MPIRSEDVSKQDEAKAAATLAEHGVSLLEEAEEYVAGDESTL